MMHQRCSSGIIHTYSYDHRVNVVSVRTQASVVQISKRASGEYRTHCKFGLHSSYEQHHIYVSFFLCKLAGTLVCSIVEAYVFIYSTAYAGAFLNHVN